VVLGSAGGRQQRRTSDHNGNKLVFHGFRLSEASVVWCV
jgi:hypothetical protein